MHIGDGNSPRNAFAIALILLSSAISNAIGRPEIKSELFPLSIIHINDFHARYEPTDTSGGACKATEECIGGYARTVHTVRSLLEEQKDNNAVYFNAGDNFQGTLWYNIGRWNVTSQFLNMLPADAMTLGNHEFDHGIDGVVPFLETLNTPMLVANIDSTNEPTMTGKYQKSMVIERSDRKIGVIGVILETTYDLANTGKLIFLNESVTILEEATKLKDQGANIIIVISHCGYDVDKLIAEKAGSVVDVIVGSHSHTFLYTGDTLPGPDAPRGDYPTIVEHSSGHKVLIVQAGAYAKYVGNLTVFFDNDGNVVDYEGAPLYMGYDVPEDPSVLETMKPWKTFIDIRGQTIIGKSSVDISKSPCDSQECALGNLFCDAMIHAYKDLRRSNKTWTDVAIGLVNNRAMKSSLHKGNAEILKQLPIWRDIVETRGSEKIGEIKVDLQYQECAYKECNIGNFYTDAILHKLMYWTPYSQGEWTNVSIALVAAGELYLTWPKGDITYSQIYSLAPFEAPLVAFNLQGNHLKAALEKSVSRIDHANNVNETNSFLQVSGLRIHYNLNNPINERVISVKVRCAACKLPIYENLQDDDIYRIIATRYVANGGHGFSIFQEYGMNAVEYSTEFEALMEYVKEVSPLYNGLENRITISSKIVY